MRDKRKLLWNYEITQSQHYSHDNNHNDDNVMRASMWFDFGGLLWCQNPWYMGGERANKKWDLNWHHPLPRVSRYTTRSNIKEVDITEVWDFLYIHI